MSGLYGFVLLLHIIASALVVLIILIQPAKGEGLTGAFGSGGNTQALFGVRAGDVMTKATAFIAVFFVITSISLAFLQVKKGSSVMAESKSTVSETVPMDPNAKSDVLNKYTDEVSGKIKNLFAAKDKDGTSGTKKEVTKVDDVAKAEATVAAEVAVTEEAKADEAVATEVTELEESAKAAEEVMEQQEATEEKAA